MLKTLFDIVVSVYFSSITYNSNVYIVLYILFSIICAILISRIVSYRWVNNLLGFISNKSINNNVWRDKLDFVNGTKLCVTVNDKNMMYYGNFEYCEENGIDSWFVLNNYAISFGGNKTYSPCVDNPDAKLVIQLKNVERIEIFPNDNVKDNLDSEESKTNSKDSSYTKQSSKNGNNTAESILNIIKQQSNKAKK